MTSTEGGGRGGRSLHNTRHTIHHTTYDYQYDYEYDYQYDYIMPIWYKSLWPSLFWCFWSAPQNSKTEYFPIKSWMSSVRNLFEFREQYTEDFPDKSQDSFFTLILLNQNHSFAVVWYINLDQSPQIQFALMLRSSSMYPQTPMVCMMADPISFTNSIILRCTFFAQFFIWSSQCNFELLWV